MVDSPKGGVMAGGLENITKRVERLEGTVEAVVASLKELSASVISGFVEQREYTEFAFQRLDVKIDTGLARLEAKIDGVDSRLGAKIDGVDSRLERVERKLDQFIDVQSQTNRLTDLRLRAREVPGEPGTVNPER